MAVAVIGAATVMIKAAGPVLAAGRELPEATAGVLELLAPALLAALVATNAFASDGASCSTSGAPVWRPRARRGAQGAAAPGYRGGCRDRRTAEAIA